MHDEGKYSWYTCINNIFKEFDLDIEAYSNIDKPQVTKYHKFYYFYQL
jgi:hypothetical protein